VGELADLDRLMRERAILAEPDAPTALHRTNRDVSKERATAFGGTGNGARCPHTTPGG
jgi:hypothetical protein